MTMVGAQSGPPESDPGIINEYPRTRFSVSMAIIIVVTIGALFFIGLVSIYIRYCYNRSMHSHSAATAVGLDPSVIDSFPTFSYSEVTDHEIRKESLGCAPCAVCLNEFEDEQTMRLIPKCNHVFHLECIGAWLDSHVTCPVCRANLIPQAGHVPEMTNVESTIHSRNDPFVTQVAGCTQSQPQPEDTSSFEYPNRPPRSSSILKPAMSRLGKFKSHSTGHSFVQLDNNIDRFTLRLPEEGAEPGYI